MRVAHREVVGNKSGLAQLQARVRFQLQEVVEAAGDRVATVEQGLVQQRRDAALAAGEVAVARTQRQAVVIANRGYADHLYVDAQVGHHFANDGQLLKVFFSKNGDLRPDDIEQLVDHRGHAIEMARALTAAQRLGEIGDTHQRLRGEPVGVDLAHRRGKQIMHALGEQFLAVGAQGTRVAV